MSLSIVYSRASSGMDAPLVTIEVHLCGGMAGFNMVGLPEKTVKESKDRVKSALVNAKFEFPISRITVNLAPADLPKEGGRFDLPIALGILAASFQIPADILLDYEFAGELALSGELRAIRGVLPFALATQREKRLLIVPSENQEEAALAEKAHVLSAPHLLDVCAHLCGQKKLQVCRREMKISESIASHHDLIDVRGQTKAKRALEIAAAGKHSLLYLGPPGTGKTMLASRLPSILPPINDDEALEVAAITSLSHSGFDAEKWKHIPFRAPHHTSSPAALVGGGSPPKPGEISLANHGVLFLDELPEFSRYVLECLREPLESGHVTISRAAFQTAFPATFQLIASMNPCPCGYAGSEMSRCRCNEENIKRYFNKISGPLLDRIDMHVEVARPASSVLLQQNAHEGEKSDSVRERVIEARARQMSRQKKCNALLTVAELSNVAKLDQTAEDLLQQIMTKFQCSARVYHRLIKLALTIADLEGAESLTPAHISEVLNYRCLDKVGMYKI